MNRTIRLCTTLLFLLGCSSAPLVRPEPIFVIEDPPAAAAEGLDLLRLAAYPAEGGTTFEATFARTIRREVMQRVDPYGRQRTSSPAPRTPLVTNEFSGLQLDIYIDLEPGGGGFRALLPGTDVGLAAPARWEKAISLVPEPIEARASLRRYVNSDASSTTTDAERKQLEDRLRLAIEPVVYHPDIVELESNVVRFFVPNRVLNGRASADWAYAVVVLETEKRRMERQTTTPRPQEVRVGGTVVDVLGSSTAGEVPIVRPAAGG